MGKKDTVTKLFLKNNEIFADVFNGAFFGGEQLIKPSSLREMDTSLTTDLMMGKDSASFPVQRYRDVLKSVSMMEDGETVFLILAIEEQSEVHYAMPVKVMLYDAMQYTGQVDEIVRIHRKDSKEEKSAVMTDQGNKTIDTGESIFRGEFLSGFYKEDRVMPVMTLVINFSSQEWDAPVSLHQMMKIKNPDLYQYIPDYKINLLSPYRMSDTEINRFHSDMREVLLYLKYSKDKIKLRELTEKDEKFQHLDKQTANTINAITNSKMTFEEGKKVVNMCKAIQDLVEEGREEGRLLQFIEDARTFCMEESQILSYLIQKFGLSEQEANERLTGQKQ